jgi:hypothetical protein
MENFKAIEFHQARDFSRKMNVTFEFIKQNFKPLSKCILFIAVPPILLAMLIFGSFISDMFGLSFNSAGQDELLEAYFLSPTFWLQIIVAMILFLVSTVMNLATINNYIVLYGEKKTNKIEVAEVWDRVRSTFWMYLGTVFAFMLVAIVAVLILAIPVGILATISPVLSIFGGIAVYVAIIYLIFGSSFTFFIRLYEKKGFLDSLFRSFKLVRDKWWSTFGLIFVLYLIMGISSYLFIVPWYVVTVVTALHNTAIDTFQEPSLTWQIMTIVFFTLYYLAQMFLAALPNVGIAFQYFNLVELKEAKGLMHQIDSIGQTPAATAAHDEDF